MYAKIENGIARWPYTIDLLKQENKGVSFPSEISAEILESFGVVQVEIKPEPAVELHQKTQRLDPVFVDGKWVQDWSVVNKQQHEIDQENQVQANLVRADRDVRLAETDWVVIKNLELNQNIPGIWEVYRQALRDIPSQPGFPWDINWPSKPE